MTKRKALVLAGAVLAAAIAVVFATGKANAAVVTPKAHAVTANRPVTGPGNWDEAVSYYSTLGYDECYTVQSSYPAGSGKAAPFDPVVMGQCSNALSQKWLLGTPTPGAGRFIIFSYLADGGNGRSLCITLGAQNGGPIGGAVVVGDCSSNAPTQQFLGGTGQGGDGAWVDTAMKTNTGQYFAINNKNGVLAPGQPYNVAWAPTNLAAQAPASEDVNGPDCHTTLCKPPVNV